MVCLQIYSELIIGKWKLIKNDFFLMKDIKDLTIKSNKKNNVIAISFVSQRIVSNIIKDFYCIKEVRVVSDGKIIASEKH